MNILVIEDEKALAENMIGYLEQCGYHCEWADRVSLAQSKVWSYTYDCVIVDITLPDGSGLDVIGRLKSMKSESGIIIVSAKNSTEDKINGLDIGADDYLTKPFDLSELNARIRSVIRRKKFDSQNEIAFNEITIIPYDHVIKVNDKSINLTRKEFDLLLYFVTNQNRVITKGSIAEHLWGDDMDLADSLDFIYSHVKNLRKKLIDGGSQDYIQTVYGVGYKMTVE